MHPFTVPSTSSLHQSRPTPPPPITTNLNLSHTSNSDSPAAAFNRINGPSGTPEHLLTISSSPRYSKHSLEVRLPCHRHLLKGVDANDFLGTKSVVSGARSGTDLCGDHADSTGRATAHELVFNIGIGKWCTTCALGLECFFYILAFWGWRGLAEHCEALLTGSPEDFAALLSTVSSSASFLSRLTLLSAATRLHRITSNTSTLNVFPLAF